MSGISQEKLHVIKSYVLVIRSQDGVGNPPDANGNPILTGFDVNLFQPITCLGNQSFLLSVASFEFPYGFYTTTNTNNTVVCRVQNIATGDITGNINITIPPGNYTAWSLMVEFINLFDAAFPLGSTGNPGGSNTDCTLNMVYDFNTNKYNFLLNTRNPDGTINNRMAFLNFSTSFEQFGFRQVNSSISFGSVNVTPLGSTSDSIVNVQPIIQNVYIRTSLNSTYSFETRTGSLSTVLQKIPISVDRWDYDYYDYSQTSSKEILTRHEIQNFRIRITDSNDNLVDTNGIHFNMSLQFDVIKRPTFNMPDYERRLESQGLQGTPDWLDVTSGNNSHAGKMNNLRLINAVQNIKGVPKDVVDELEKLKTNNDLEGEKIFIPGPRLGETVFLAPSKDQLEYDRSWTNEARQQNMRPPIIPIKMETRKPQEEKGNEPGALKDEDKLN